MEKLIKLFVLLSFISLKCLSWDGSTEIWNNGSGTIGDPYQIHTAENLAYLAASTTDGENWNGVYFELLANLDLSGCEWVSIGNSTTSFNGNFNGSGHFISGLTIENQKNDNGLFGKTGSSAVISNLGIESNCNLSPQNAYNFGTICGYSNGLIMNCYNRANIYAVSGVVVGGICGLDNGTITNCYNTGNIYGQTHIGGIAGDSYNEMSVCYNVGLIQATIGEYGAIVGYSNFSYYNYCFYNSDVGSATGAGDLSDNTLHMVSLTTADMKLQLFVDSLNNGPEFYQDTIQPWTLDVDQINNGYPVFLWELSTKINSNENISLTIFPNPVSDRLFIHSEAFLDFVEIYDLAGNIICSIDCRHTNEIKTEFITPGVYVLNVYFINEGQSSLFFIKQ